MPLQIRNSSAGWGIISITLHWLIAMIVIGMFISGLYMTSLTYYDPWYHKAPALHKSVGSVLFLLMLLRLSWRLGNPLPEALANHTQLEQVAARIAHILLYLLLFTVIISGYLIATAKGKPVDVFGLFQLPALLAPIEQQEDIAGTIHLVLAIILIALATLHALAALKHHLFDRDQTLLRMLGESPETKNQRRKS